jgi:hypothetical protein
MAKPTTIERLTQQAATLDAGRAAVDLSKAELEQAIAAALVAGDDTSALEAQYAALGGREAGLRAAAGNTAAALVEAENAALLTRFEGYVRLEMEAEARKAERDAELQRLHERRNAILAEQVADNAQSVTGKKLNLLREGMARGIATQMHAIASRLQRQRRAEQQAG